VKENVDAVVKAALVAMVMIGALLLVACGSPAPQEQVVIERVITATPEPTSVPTQVPPTPRPTATPSALWEQSPANIAREMNAKGWDFVYEAEAAAWADDRWIGQGAVVGILDAGMVMVWIRPDGTMHDGLGTEVWTALEIPITVQNAYLEWVQSDATILQAINQGNATLEYRGWMFLLSYFEEGSLGFSIIWPSTNVGASLNNG